MEVALAAERAIVSIPEGFPATVRFNLTSVAPAAGGFPLSSVTALIVTPVALPPFCTK